MSSLINLSSLRLENQAAGGVFAELPNLFLLQPPEGFAEELELNNSMSAPSSSLSL
jgi:hypothetical protein